MMSKVSFLLATLLIAFLVLAFAGGGAQSVVEWRSQRAIALESDDWGLAGFVPHADSWAGLDRKALGPGRFPAVYWQSTLEDGPVVDRLVQLLAAHKGRDGVAAVFQPNYVMASLGWDAQNNQWLEYRLPQWPSQYERPKLWDAVKRGQAQGVWHAELHAWLHYDSAVRYENAFSTAVAGETTRRGISLFPDSEGARELAPWRPAELMAAELDSSLAIFEEVFGRRAYSIIAPDYTWHSWCEKLWRSRGLHVIQAKREQRNPQWLAGKPGRVQKYLDRQWSRITAKDRTYLERNCRLEPVQAQDPAAVVQKCVEDTYSAWKRGEPAIVETHRVNFSHTDPAVVDVGMHSLAEYLQTVSSGPDGPIFLCDNEIAMLNRQGTSWRVAGDRLVVRNATHASRVVVVPADVMTSWGTSGNMPGIFLVGAGEVNVLTAFRLP